MKPPRFISHHNKIARAVNKWNSRRFDPELKPKPVRCPRCNKDLEPDRFNEVWCLDCRERVAVKR